MATHLPAVIEQHGPHLPLDTNAFDAGRVGKVAESAGITPRQLHKLMTKHDLHKEHFRRPR